MDVAKELQLRSNELLEPQKKVTGIDPHRVDKKQMVCMWYYSK